MFASNQVFHTLTMLALLAPSRPAHAPQKKHQHLFNEESDPAKEFPFAVALEFKNGLKRSCSGSMLTDSWVITAGHCVSPAEKSPYIIRYGNVTVPLEDTHAFSKILQWIRHPHYYQPDDRRLIDKYAVILNNNKQRKRGLDRNDIGMLQVEKVQTKTFAKLSAMDYMSLIGQGAKYAGFGLVDVVSTDAYNKSLRVGEAAVVKCLEDPGGFPAVCLSSKCGTSQPAYYGEPGGPLVCGGQLVGVASRVGPRMIYTPVSPYLTWIRDTITNFKPKTRDFKKPRP